MEGTVEVSDGLAKINFAALVTGLEGAQRSLDRIRGMMADLAGAYAVQETAEKRLEAVMRQRMGASAEEVQSIYDLASAQQELGVIGDEVQLAGAGQMAAFLSERESIEKLLPAMNDLLAQQKGLEATSADAAAMGTALGKAMSGQTGALRRMGITFTEAQERVMKYGTESERAAVLASVVQSRVGGMNAALADTDSGRQQQLANALGDVKERIGALAQGALPFVTIAAQAGSALASVVTLCKGIGMLTAAVTSNIAAFFKSAKAWGVAHGGIRGLTAAVWGNIAAFTKSAWAWGAARVKLLAHKAASIGVAVATKAMTAAQWLLNTALSANPVGIVVMALAALGTALYQAYQRCEGFRKICDRVWAAVKPLAEAIGRGLVRALEWVAEKCKLAYDGLCKLLGPNGGEVTLDVKVDPKSQQLADRLTAGAAADKYKDYTDKPAKPAKTSKAPTSAPPKDDVFKENASTLAEYEANIRVLQGRLQTATLEEAAGLNQQIALWEKKEQAVRDAGKAVGEINPNAGTIAEIEDNLRNIDEMIRHATPDKLPELYDMRDAWETQLNTLKDIGKASAGISRQWHEMPRTIAEIDENLAILDDQLKHADFSQIADIVRRKKALEELKRAQLEAGLASRDSFGELRKGWGAVTGITRSLTTMSDTLRGSASWWEKISAVVEAFFAVVQGAQAVIAVLEAFGVISKANAAAATVEAGAQTAATVSKTASIPASEGAAAATAPEVAANKELAASLLEVAAAGYLAAHADIPIFGFAIGSGFASAAATVVKTIGSVAAFANGGIAYGPTLGLFGEYAGAANNPEVVAPLDKLRTLIEPAAPAWGEVDFRIRGEVLEGVLSKRRTRLSRAR